VPTARTTLRLNRDGFQGHGKWSHASGQEEATRSHPIAQVLIDPKHRSLSINCTLGVHSCIPITRIRTHSTVSSNRRHQLRTGSEPRKPPRPRMMQQLATLPRTVPGTAAAELLIYEWYTWATHGRDYCLPAGTVLPPRRRFAVRPRLAQRFFGGETGQFPRVIADHNYHSGVVRVCRFLSAEITAQAATPARPRRPQRLSSCW
jgi:hypothetical protein